MKIACIGTRTLPEAIRKRLWNLGRLIALAGWTVASGNAQGSDQAYQDGANSVDPGLVRLFLPWAGYEQKAINPLNRVYVAWGEAYRQLAANLYGAWRRLNPATGGGLAQAVRIAKELEILPRRLKVKGTEIPAPLMASGRELPKGPEFVAPPEVTFADLSTGAQKLMARNVAIVQGADLVVAYPSREKSWGGGTGFGIRVARAMEIPVVDLSCGSGLEHLMRLVDALPGVESQVAFIEVIWWHRACGLWPKDVYEDRMQAAVRALMWEVSQFFQLAQAWELLEVRGGYPEGISDKLAGSLLWDCIQEPIQESKLEGIVGELDLRVPDPIFLRTLLSPWAPLPERETEDSEAPETELSAMLVAHDTGNPTGDRFTHEATLHGGQRRWYESCHVMPSGIVIRDAPPERTYDALLAKLDMLAWGWFRLSFRPKHGRSLPVADQRLFLELREALLELELTGRLLDEYLGDLDREVLAAKETLAKERRANTTGAYTKAMADAARTVLGEHISRLRSLAVAVGPSDPEPESSRIDWRDMRERVRLQYPTATESMVDFAVQRAQELWSTWIHTPEEEGVSRTSDFPDEEDLDELVVTFSPHKREKDGVPFRGTSQLVVGHLWKALEPWESRRPQRLAFLLNALRNVSSRKELAVLEVQAGEFSRADRRVLDSHVRLARKRVAVTSPRRYARFIRECSVGVRTITELEQLMELARSIRPQGVRRFAESLLTRRLAEARARKEARDRARRGAKATRRSDETTVAALATTTH